MKKELTWACCDNCGSDNVTVETQEPHPDWVFDGDTLTCEDCGEKGWASCDCEEGAYAYWHCSEEINPHVDK